MTDTPLTPTGEAEAEASRIAAAQERFDSAVSGIMGLTPSENVNASMLQSAVRAIRNGLFAVLVEPDAPATEAPRDETHDSIDPHTGTLTPQAAALRAAMLPTSGGLAAPPPAEEPTPKPETPASAPDPVEPATSPAA